MRAEKESGERSAFLRSHFSLALFLAHPSKDLLDQVE
jgi:hypothetical protein